MLATVTPATKQTILCNANPASIATEPIVFARIIVHKRLGSI